MRLYFVLQHILHATLASSRSYLITLGVFLLESPSVIFLAVIAQVRLLSMIGKELMVCFLSVIGSLASDGIARAEY